MPGDTSHISGYSSVNQTQRSQYGSVSKRMKMAYEYARVSQVFTISSVPKEWVYPVSILINAYFSTNKDPQF